MMAVGRILVVVALVVASVTSAAWCLSSIYSKKVERELIHWAQNPSSVDSAQLDEIWTIALRAQSLQPFNAHQLYLKGKVAEWQAYVNADESKQWLNQSLEALQQSAQLRPNWPDTWLEIANIKRRQSKFDSEFHTALSKASALGPYKRNVTLDLAQLTLSLWGTAEAKIHSHLMSTLKRAMNSPLQIRHQVYRMARSMELEVIVCTAWKLEYHDQSWSVCEANS